MRTIEHDHPTDHLYDVHVLQAVRQRVGSLPSTHGRTVEHADFEQLAAVEGLFYGAERCLGDALLAEVDEGLERMSLGTQKCALFGR